MEIITNNEWYKTEILRTLESISKKNYFFAPIYEILMNTKNLDIIIKDEDDVLEDVNNTSKSITEFRAYLQYDSIVIFNTRYETPESIIWLLFHEIAHYILSLTISNYCFDKIINQDYLVKQNIITKLNEDYQFNEDFMKVYTQDLIHEGLPEEQMCNTFANFLLGYCRDRVWWRKQIQNG